MQLLLKRSQSPGRFRRPVFKLWAYFKLTDEERRLIDRYRADAAILWEGDFYRDLIWSLRIAVVPAVLIALLAFATGGFVQAVVVLIIAYAAAARLVYQQIREEVRVGDLISGRYFSCRSIVALTEKEDTITRMAVVFRRFLEAMKNWGGEEIIAIEPDKVPRIELDERPHAAA